MKAATRAILLITAALALLSGCATTFVGPQGYVAYRQDGKIKNSKQSALGVDGKEIQSTYEDEFVYDDAGNMLKHKQTEYFGTGKTKFVVYETNFKVVGGVTLPTTVSVNGTVYMNVDYELLSASTAKGEITQGSVTRYFTQIYRHFLSTATDNVRWNIDLAEYPVDFEADGKFVVNHSSFSPYYGFDKDHVLTLGYDNVVLKRYSYSYADFTAGFKKSFTNSFEASMYEQQTKFWKNSSYSFDYDWAVNGGKICQTKVAFSRTVGTFKVYFEDSMEYDKAGGLTSEIWSVANAPLTGATTKEKPVVVYKQEIAY